MAQAGALGVYEYIDSWWGERFDRDLADRIASAPWDHLQSFAAGWPWSLDLYMSRQVEDLTPGELRPVFGQFDGERELAVATRMLLYTPSVLIDQGHLDALQPIRLGPVVDNEATRGTIRRSLTWLATTRPLVEDGSLLYAGKEPGRHPSRSRLLDDAYNSLRGWSLDDFEGVAPQTVADSVRPLGGNLYLAQAAKGTLLGLSKSEDLVYRAWLGAGRAHDNRIDALRLLSRLNVPDFSEDAAALVSVRRNADAFADWRASLTNAMRAVEDVPDTDRGIDEARAIVAYELDASASKIRREVERSPALVSLRRGARSLGITAVGAAATAAVMAVTPDAVLGALAGAAGAVGTGATEAGLAYFNALRSRREGRAVLDIVMSFREPD